MMPIASIVLVHDSFKDLSADVGYGPRWDLGIERRIAPGTAGGKSLFLGDGTEIELIDQGSQWVPVDMRRSRSRFTLSDTGAVEYLPGGDEAHFTRAGSVYWLSKFRDKNGVETTYSRDAAQRITGITYPYGRSLEMDIQGGKVQAIKVKVNGSTLETYSLTYASGIVTQVTVPGNVPYQIIYAENGFVTFFRVPSGKHMKVEYNARGYRTRITDELNYVTAFNYSATEVLVHGPAGLAYEKFHTLNGEGYLTHSHVDGLTTTYELDDHMRVAAEISPTGLRTSYHYDGSSSFPDRVYAPGNVTTEFTYDAAGRNLIREEVTSNGRTEVNTMTWNAREQLVTENLAGVIRSMEYDTFGNLTRRSKNGVVEYEATYDGDGRVLTETDAQGLTTTNTYAPDGKIATITDHFGRTSTFERDLMGHVVKTIANDGMVKDFTFDDAGVTTESITSRPGSSQEKRYTVAYERANTGHLFREVATTYVNGEQQEILETVHGEALGQPGIAQKRHTGAHGTVTLLNRLPDAYERTVQSLPFPSIPQPQ